ncbi:MAG: hypothetical protein ACE5GW_09695 [Planctomycetota bacterium]
MSQFLSRVDKTTTRCYYEIDINHDTQLPRSIRMVVLTGVKSGDKKKGSFGNEEHVAFHFDYSIEAFNEVASVKVPRAAQKILR